MRLAAGSGFVTALGGIATLPVTVPAAAVALQELPGRVLIELNKKVGHLLVTKAREKGVVNLSKLVPLVGGPIGATVDGLGCRTIATYALQTFPTRFGGAVVVDGEVVDGEVVDRPG